MLTDAWTPLDYHPVQSRLWRTQASTCVVRAARGSGKSELAKRRCVRFLPVNKAWDNPMYFYALPTRDQAKRVAWKHLKSLVPEAWLARPPYETDLIIVTKFGSELHLLGMDKPMRAEGVQWDGGVVDESADQKPGVIDLNLGPAMTHRDPWLWRIGVPKRNGCGAAEFNRAFDLAAECEDGSMEAYTWSADGVVPEEKLAQRRGALSKEDYDEQYGAEVVRAGGLVFHAFDSRAWPVGNLDDSVCHQPDRPLIVGQDFNVDPMAWSLMHKVEGELHVFDEVWERNTNTPKTLDVLWRRYGKEQRGPWLFMGDASSSARKTSAASTDYRLIAGDERFKPKRVLYPKSNPPVLDRFAACNAVLENALGVRRCKVHPRCQHLVDDLEARSYKRGTREPDDSGDVSHMSDAWGYVVYQLFPIAVQGTGSKVYVDSER